jgi:hypothetical protein
MMTKKIDEALATLSRVVPTRFSGEVAVVKAEIENLLNVVSNIGRAQERIDVLGEDGDENYDKIFEEKEKCVALVQKDRAERGLFYCELCGDEYQPDASISKHFCGYCMDENDMVRYKDDWAVDFGD